MVNNSILSCLDYRDITMFLLAEVNTENDLTVYVHCFPCRKHDYHEIRDEILCALCQSRLAFVSVNNGKQFFLSAYDPHEQLFVLCYLVLHLFTAYLSKLGNVDRRSLRWFVLSRKADVTSTQPLLWESAVQKHSSIVDLI